MEISRIFPRSSKINKNKSETSKLHIHHHFPANLNDDKFPHACALVWEILKLHTASKRKKNIKIKMQREILLVKSASKNYKCSSRLHILQQQQKYVHTKILFSVLYTESQNKLFFLLLLLHRCSFMAKILHPRMNFVYFVF